MFWLPEKLISFVNWLGLSTETVTTSPAALLFFGSMAIFYLLTVPITASIAKRGLFLGADRILFPGWQDGDGAYQKERAIFGSVGLRVHEAPIDLWILGTVMLIWYAFSFLTVEQTIAWQQSWWAQPSQELGFDQVRMTKIGHLVGIVVFVIFFVIAAVRRTKLGRA